MISVAAGSVIDAPAEPPVWRGGLGCKTIKDMVLRIWLEGGYEYVNPLECAHLEFGVKCKWQCVPMTYTDVGWSMVRRYI